MTKGFTLAETLITLVIVGVIAALTIPNLIIKYQKEQTVTKIKKVYSVIQQATLSSERDNGPLENWEYPTTHNSKQISNFYSKYLKKYFSTLKDYGYVSQATLGVQYKFLNNNPFPNGWELNSGLYRIVLNDGTMLSIGEGVYTSNHYINVYADINGLRKPNKLGKDVFAFTIQPKYKAVPFGYQNAENGFSFGSTYNRNVLTGSSERACKKSKQGWWCTALIMYDGWKISDDYPW